jgi:AhpD family alkylhydroperoxidase
LNAAASAALRGFALSNPCNYNPRMDRRTFAEFRDHRARGNEAIGSADHLSINRFMRLDSATYEDATAAGGLPAKTKEMLGLVASMVLRCNDCIDYHLEQCVKHGYGRAEIVDGMNVALVVGGSIVIPHLRHALLSLDELLAGKQ